MGFMELGQGKFRRKTYVFLIHWVCCSEVLPCELWLLLVHLTTALAQAAETMAAPTPACCFKINFFLEDAGTILLLIPHKMQTSSSVSSDSYNLPGVLEIRTFHLQKAFSCLISKTIFMLSVCMLNYPPHSKHLRQREPISTKKTPTTKNTTHFYKIKNRTRLFLVIKVPSFWRPICATGWINWPYYWKMRFTKEKQILWLQ